MSLLDLAAAFITLTTLLTYVNYRFIRMPPAIGVMVTALLLSLIVHVLAMLGYPVIEVEMQKMIRDLDFSQTLMTWFLPALLFAGALHVDLNDLRQYKWAIGILATVGVLVATFVVGALAWLTFDLLGMNVSFLYCLLFGALISPTDPIAVMGILKSSGAPGPLRATIVGESLFNDGTAVVVFSILLGILLQGSTPTAHTIFQLFLQEAVGGILTGLALGFGAYRLMRTIDQYQLEVMLTLALVIGGAALATRLHVSAPLALVVAGLIIGNHARKYALSDETRRYLDKFWELVDEMLNALLFALIGLEMLVVPFSWFYLLIALLMLAAVLAARALTVAPGILGMRLFRSSGELIARGATRILVWGGLRGGVSVALALSLPQSPQRDLILAITYCAVLFSILGQGLSIGVLIRKIHGAAPAGDETNGH